MYGISACNYSVVEDRLTCGSFLSDAVALGSIVLEHKLEGELAKVGHDAGPQVAQGRSSKKKSSEVQGHVPEHVRLRCRVR